MSETQTSTPPPALAPGQPVPISPGKIPESIAAIRVLSDPMQLLEKEADDLLAQNAALQIENSTLKNQVEQLTALVQKKPAAAGFLPATEAELRALVNGLEKKALPWGYRAGKLLSELVNERWLLRR